MDQNPEDFQKRPLSDAEMRRIESETAKNRAEERKFIAEAQEAEKRVRKKWFANELYWRWVLGGLIGGCLAVAWAITYFYPIFNAKQELAKLENMRLAEDNARKTQISEKRLQENERITAEKFELIIRSDSLVKQLNLTSHQLYLTSQQLNLTSQEGSKLKEQVGVLQGQVNLLSQGNVQLRLRTIYFDSTSFELRPDAKASLDENVKTLQEFPDIKIRIEAYGDGISWSISMEHRGLNYKTFFDRDLAVGEKRARKAMDYLTEHGISASRITIIGHPGEPQSTRRQCRFVIIKQ